MPMGDGRPGKWRQTALEKPKEKKRGDLADPTPGTGKGCPTASEAKALAMLLIIHGQRLRLTIVHAPCILYPFCWGPASTKIPLASEEVLHSDG